MDNYGYGWEKLHSAVSALTGSRDQATRLASAMLELVLIKPQEDLPPPIRDDFEAFVEQMTSVSAKDDEGTIQATINELDELGLHRATEKIVGFYDAVCRYRPRH